MSWRRFLRRNGAALAIASLFALCLAGSTPSFAQDPPADGATDAGAMDEGAMTEEAMPAETMPADGMVEDGEASDPDVVEMEPMDGEAAMPAEAMPQDEMSGDAMPAEEDAATEMAPEPGMEKEMMEEAPADQPAAVELPMPDDVPGDEAMGGEPKMMEGQAMPEQEAMQAPPPPAAAPPPPPPVVAPKPRGPPQLEIGTGYKGPGYRQVTGLIFSEAHGRRLVRTYVSPLASAKIYRQNAAKVRQGVADGLQRFPVGTVIVQESYARTRTGTPGKTGPLFVMKKETSGYDPSGNDWRYAFAQSDLKLIGDGTKGPVASCKSCHTKVRDRDFVMAMDR